MIPFRLSNKNVFHGNFPGHSAATCGPRIKAVFSIEPAEGPAIIPVRLAAIEIPIAFVAAFGDRILRHEGGRLQGK